MNSNIRQHAFDAAFGSDQGLSELVRTYHQRVLRFGQRVCHDAFDADDAVQEAFLLLADRPEVQAHPGVLSWLMTTVRNACRRVLRPFSKRKQPLNSPEALQLTVSESSNAQVALERQELVQAVHQAIAGLDPALRCVLVLRDLEGLSGEETCRALGLELAAMKTRLHRARAALRELLLQRQVVR